MPTTTRRLTARRGFTLIEMMMAILLTMLVFAITIPFFRIQTKAVDVGAGRLDALQNARYAQNAIDRELRLAGGITGQPVIVQADKFAITFNVDLVSTDSLDPNATYYNPSADTLGTESWQPSRAKTLPTSTKTYPTQFYKDANLNQSRAETISYFLYVDASTGRSDLYTLFRRVNDRDSTIVTRNLWIPTDTNYFFKYQRADASGAIQQIPQASLPIYWDATSQLADSIRIVQMRIAGLYRDVRKSQDVTRTIYHNTRLYNAGLLKQLTCGSPPLGANNVVATQVYDAFSNLTNIHITWDKSLEETGGEADVAAYVIQRRPVAGTDWEVIGTLLARNYSSYSFDDFGFHSGQWVYGVVAQDCSPANSTVTSSGTITNP
jgi:prepilin-type N-terminal cleavage/methylation domain-containing protein